MKTYQVKIEGITPYMQHRMDDQKLEAWEKNRKLIIERPEVAQEDAIRAEFHSYNDGKNYYLPADHIKGAMIAAGKMVKSKVGNSKKSMANIVAGMFFVTPDRITLPPFTSIDKRSAVNKNIKARVISIRPKWDEWQAEFTLNIDNDTITKETITEILTIAGNFIGIGSFRPTCNGSFGRFQITSITLK